MDPSDPVLLLYGAISLIRFSSYLLPQYQFSVIVGAGLFLFIRESRYLRFFILLPYASSFILCLLLSYGTLFSLVVSS